MKRDAEILISLLNTPEPPALGPQRRESAWPLAVAQQQIDELVKAAFLSGTGEQLVRSLALLWHDHLEASHELSQGIHTADGSYLHGIMHRREPDFGNAAYWFRRVGEHAIYSQLAREVAGLPGDSEFKARLIAGERWNPLAMIDACEAVEVEAADPGDAEFLRTVQTVEFRLLLQHFRESRCD
jgi:hypothetical protein